MYFVHPCGDERCSEDEENQVLKLKENLNKCARVCEDDESDDDKMWRCFDPIALRSDPVV